MGNKMLFPSSMLNPARVDEAFQWQVDGVSALDGPPPALVDLGSLNNTGYGKSLRRVEEGDTLVYRGWMMSPQDYVALADKVEAAGATLLTSAEKYRKAHYLPGWYVPFCNLTARSIWFPAETSIDEIHDVIASNMTGPLMVKDFVKSRKHEWDDALFMLNVAELPRVVGNFLNLQGDALEGGVVIREFEDFDRFIGEVRAWWVHGELVMVTAHPDTPDRSFVPSDEFLGQVANAVSAIACPFVTTDITLLVNGEHRVVEVGDGGVSDFPVTGDIQKLLSALLF